ncbi:MAG: GIY-YIG nuclease family protein [Selenomonadaceae bacterium]|nr:GIY-YIG nuclease family protein [Selenomonadaceae bacterium]
MSTDIQVFNHPKFGDVRVIERDDEPFFAGCDVAIALGYSNPNDALAKHVPDKYKLVLQVAELDNEKATTFISLNGLSELVRHSDSTYAQDFEWWIATVVTSLIATICDGGEKYDVLFGNIDFLIDILRIYAGKAQYGRAEYIKWLLEKFAESAAEAKKNPDKKCVYILEMSNGKVKIGCTKNFIRRVRQIETGSGLKVTNWCHTSYINSSRAYAIESYCHRVFNEHRILGEFFDITFEDAWAELSKHEDITDSKNLEVLS